MRLREWEKVSVVLGGPGTGAGEGMEKLSPWAQGSDDWQCCLTGTKGNVGQTKLQSLKDV